VAEGEGVWREYIGGYSDWERVRSRGAAAVAAEVVKPAVKSVAAAAATKEKTKKLSFKEQRELEQLPELIAALETEQAEISAKLADAELYRNQPDQAQKLNQRYAEIDELLMSALERWEAMEVRAKS
jgi:ATP-binding cassette subfamily F protein uup